MSLFSSTPPAKMHSNCPASENAAFVSKQSLARQTYRSGSVGGTLGRRSLDAFTSMRQSFRGRRALHPTTNQKLAISTSSASVGNGSREPPTKQRWYDSLRGKSSQIPTPSRPAPMSFTLKRSRFFGSSPDQSPIDGPSLSLALQTQTRNPLPKLQIASSQFGLKHPSIFGNFAMRPSIDTGKWSIAHQPLPFLPRR